MARHGANNCQGGGRHVANRRPSLPPLILAPKPLAAQSIAYRAAALDDAEVSYSRDAGDDIGTERLLAIQPAPTPQGIAAYGPFRVLDAEHAALVDVADTGVISCVGGPELPLGIAASCGHSTRPVTDRLIWIPQGNAQAERDD